MTPSRLTKCLGLSVFALSLIPSLCLAGPRRADLIKSYKSAGTFLLKIQNKNGSWGRIPGMKGDGEMGMTALAVLALSEAPKELRADYREACGKAAAWIAKHQAKDGSITQPRTGLATYRTSLSLMALKAFDAKKYKTAVDKARAWIVGAQVADEAGVKSSDKNYGGWGYGRGQRPNCDLSNAVMALQALKESGLSEDSPVYKRALAFLSRCQNNAETNKGVKGLKPLNDGGFFYKPTDRASQDGQSNKDGTVSHDSYAGMTYAGLMSLLYSNVKKDDPRVKAAKAWIAKHYTLDKNYGLGLRKPEKGADQAGLYYYYMSFAKCLDALGSETLKTKSGDKNWPSELTAVLIKKQKAKGYWINEANGRWWENNPLLPTLYALNALNRAEKYFKGAKAGKAGKAEKTEKTEKTDKKRRF